MSRLALITGMVSLTLCCCYTSTPPEEVGSMETASQSYVSVTPAQQSKCSNPPEKENAYLVGDWVEGQPVTYTCRPGYVPNGRIRMICLEGKWQTLSSGYCKKRSCGHPGDIPFGTFELKNSESFVFGAEVEYSCNDGYQMVSKQNTRICAADGWTNHLPHCEARLCPPVNDDSVRVLTYVTDGEFSMGHVISFKCKNPKQKLRGPSTIYCTSDGTWNTNPPTCKSDVIRKNVTGSCTVQENDMRKNNIQLKDTVKRHFNHTEDVQFECVSAYRIKYPAKLQIKCKNGVLKYPHCSLSASAHCGRPPPITYGEIISQGRDSYHSGSRVKYKCPQFYTLQGHNEVTCQRGTWSDPPTCLEPCTTREENMMGNNIMLEWKPLPQTHCVRNYQNTRYAKKCYVQHGGAIHFVCKPGYSIANANKLTSRCNRGTLPYPTCSRKM
ncbi:complement factor H-related protein 1-like [Dendropsophus ebraccatus]|uniref:complement factor H-related protein 1-like n=1 Tax=Dendropsophus ebraccatus TaxID=150705 RepID=UPI0038310691